MSVFGVTVSCKSEAMCLAISGEIDLAARSELYDSIVFAGDQAHRVLLDLTGVTFIDSSGINALLDARKRCAPKGSRVIVAAASAPVRTVLHIAGVEQLLGLAPDGQAATS